MKSIVIGVDVGGSAAKIAPVEVNSGKSLRKNAFRVRYAQSDGASAFLQTIEQGIKQALESLGKSPEDVAAVGACHPGQARYRDGVWGKLTNFFGPGFEGLKFAESLGDLLSCRVWCLNDGNAAATGEALHRWGVNQDGLSLAAFALGTGVGGGYVRNGDLFLTPEECEAEFGHMPGGPKDAPCNCGTMGCVEASGSAAAFVREIQHYATKRRARHPDLNIIEGWNEIAEGDRFAKIPELVFRLASEKELHFCEELIHTAVEAWADGIVGVCAFSAPTVVTVGGGLAQLGKKYPLRGIDLLEQLHQALEGRLFGPLRGRERELVQYAQLEDPGAMGAAAYALMNL